MAGEGTLVSISSNNPSGMGGAELERTLFTTRDAGNGDWVGVAATALVLRSSSPSMNITSSSLSLGTLLMSLVKLEVGLRATCSELDEEDMELTEMSGGRCCAAGCVVGMAERHVIGDSDTVMLATTCGEAADWRFRSDTCPPRPSLLQHTHRQLDEVGPTPSPSVAQVS